jgi:hypothetical protein
MPNGKAITRLGLAVLVGIGAALSISARSAAAFVGCEMNACFTAQGNCDLTDYSVACKETLGGCQTTTCQVD